MRRYRATTVLLAAALALTGVQGATAAPARAAAGFSPALVPSVSGTVAKNLAAPWGMAFLPIGGAMIAERDSGRIRRLDGKGGSHVVGRVPGVVHVGEGGLLGIAVDAGFRSDRWVYAYFTTSSDNRIARMHYRNGRLGIPHVLLKGIPKGVIHNGGRLVFGPDGMLYVGTGETNDKPLSQNLKSRAGKVLRMTPDGKVPRDNPFPGSYVYSRGHRNVQGLAFDAQGRLFEAELGQNTWDELNLIKPGRNYGWPIVEGRSSDKRFVNPIAQWHPSEASPSGIAIVHGTVFLAALRGQRLWRIRIGPNRSDGIPTARVEDYFVGTFGRLRTVMASPAGSLWLVTNNTDGRGNPRAGDDRVLRIRLR